MAGRRNPFVAQEGLPYLLAALFAAWLAWYFAGAAAALPPAAAFVVLFLVFRDPRRPVPAVPLGVVSPVDGRIVGIDLADRGVLQGEAHRVLIRINAFGTYSARAPVEGKIMDLNTVAAHRVAEYPTNALWLRTDEDLDVVLQFRGYRFGLPPRSLVRFGERLGQGQRCAYLRLARFAEVHMPIDAKLAVAPGQVVLAGRDLLARLPHR